MEKVGRKHTDGEEIQHAFFDHLSIFWGATADVALVHHVSLMAHQRSVIPLSFGQIQVGTSNFEGGKKFLFTANSKTLKCSALLPHFLAGYRRSVVPEFGTNLIWDQYFFLFQKKKHV